MRAHGVRLNGSARCGALIALVALLATTACAPESVSTSDAACAASVVEVAVASVQPGAATVDLATVDADASGQWAVTVAVPPDALEGEAAIRVDPAEDVVVRVMSL